MPTIRAYHATHEPFDEFDFSRLGSVTQENVGGTSVEDYALNLARLVLASRPHDPVEYLLVVPQLKTR